MARDTLRSKGNEAYQKADAVLGKQREKSDKPLKALPIVGPALKWIAEGRPPTLWGYSRLCLVLGIVSIIAGFAAGGVGALFAFIELEERGVTIAVNFVTISFTFSTPAAIFLVGSGALAFLAAHNDRALVRDASSVATNDAPASTEDPVEPPSSSTK